MLAIAQQRTERELKEFHCDVDARTSDFFEAYARELPSDMGERFRAYGELFIRRHARVQLSSLFKLMRAQCNKVIHDVHVAMGVEGDAGDEDGIRESIEEAAGFEFKKPTAPESASLVSSRKRNINEVGDTEGHERMSKGQSLSQILTREEQLDLPDYVFDGVITPDPLNNAISEPELSTITDGTLLVLAKRHGRCNIGIQLARVYAKQIRKKVKIPDRGKKHIVLGKDRDIAESLVQKSRNRTYKIVSACLPPSPPPVRALILPYAHCTESI